MKKQKNKQGIKASKLAKAENRLKKQAEQIITVKNAEGEPDTQAKILIQNKVNYTPKVSVIIPVYNVEEYLRECLDSVVNQTLKEIEIICVDDGSTDNSLEILKEYAKKDNRISVLTQENLHAGVARNAGLTVAKGEYVHFLDSDDWIDKETYQELYNLMKEANVDFIKFKSYAYDNQEQKIISTSYTNISAIALEYFDKKIYPYKDYRNILEIPDAPWSGFYALEFLNRKSIRFDSLKCVNDVTFYHRCLLNCKVMYLSSNKYVYYRMNNPKSLISIRAENFDCQLKCFNNVANLVTKNSPEIGYTIKNRLLKGCYYRYEAYISNQYLPFKIYNQINNEMMSFLEHIDEHNIDINLLNYIKEKVQSKQINIIKESELLFTPKISVIIPVYNVEKYLSECLDSIINQTLKEIEIICVDDGSTDQSLKILEKYAQKDNRITIITQEKKFAAIARNIGLQKAKGEFVAFMDADDYYPKNKILAHMYVAAKKNNVSICGGSIEQLKEGKIIKTFDGVEAGYVFKTEGIKNYKDYPFDFGFTRFIYKRTQD